MCLPSVTIAYNIGFFFSHCLIFYLLPLFANFFLLACSTRLTSPCVWRMALLMSCSLARKRDLRARLSRPSTCAWWAALSPTSRLSSSSRPANSAEGPGEGRIDVEIYQIERFTLNCAVQSNLQQLIIEFANQKKKKIESNSNLQQLIIESTAEESTHQLVTATAVE